jgi:hypothetical protein
MGNPWQVTEKQRAHLESLLASFSNVLDDFELPSRYTLARCVQGFVEGFQQHLPLMHIPTLRIDNLDPGLALALCAVGAQYRFESSTGIQMFYAAKAVVFEQIRRRDRQLKEFFMNENIPRPNRPPYQLSRFVPSPTSTSQSAEATTERAARIQSTRAVLLLTAFATWERDAGVLRESFGFQSLLARCVREHGLSETPCEESLDWHKWAQAECDRRTKFIIFCFMNLQTTAYDLPPIILSNEIDLCMPCSAAEWAAHDESSWRRVRTDAQPAKFQELLSGIFRRPGTTWDASPLSNYIFLHALIQRIWLVNQLRYADAAESQSQILSQIEYVMSF